MKLKTKTLIDFWIGYPLVALLNVLAIPLGRLLRRDHRFETTGVIVVCKLMGLGSIVQITPLLTSLRKCFPSVHIVFLTRAENAELCRRLNVIDETLILDDRSLARLAVSLLCLLQRFWRMGVDLFVNLEVYSNISTILTILSCARNRIGYYLKPRDMRARGIYTHMVYFNQNAPIAQVYLQAARCIGITQLQQGLIAPHVDPADEALLSRKLAVIGCCFEKKKYIVINPNASELRVERRWPVEHYADLIHRLNERHPDLPIFLIGGPGEEPVGISIIEMLSLPPGRVFNLSGHLALPQLLVLLAHAAVFVTNDSGPMHLAFSLGTPTVALFGPVSPEHYGYTGETPRILLFRRVYCSPCVHHFLESPCRGDNQCMKWIGVDEVLPAVEALLTGTASPAVDGRLYYCSPETVFGVQRRE
jgi:ADP-heptose:LPS heptosyltransferase